jgi:putative spermidine/putrescine transport system permease protein
MRWLAVLNLLTFFYLIGPIVVILGSAFSTTEYLVFPPHGFTLHWFAAALADPRYIGAFLTSLGIAIAAAAVSLAIGLPAAYALARFDFPGRATIETVLLTPLVMPALVLSVALTVLFSAIGFTAGSVRLAVAHLVICVPYVIRVAIPVLRRLDVSVEEAAGTLGASPVATFFLVTLPAIRPGVIAAATLAFIRERRRCRLRSTRQFSSESLLPSPPSRRCSSCSPWRRWRSTRFSSGGGKRRERRGA